MREFILFDLDGTLLPMDLEEFVKVYLSRLSKFLVPYGYDPEKVISSVWAGTKAMMANDGTKTNEEVFWDVFGRYYDQDVKQDYDKFELFYEKEFPKVVESVKINAFAKEVIKKIKEKGYRVALATNPLFPRVATFERVRWTGIEPNEFELITTYETSSYCKPNLKYYEDVCQKLGVEPNQCIMVGNDVLEDGIAKELGMKVFLIKDSLLNPKGEDLSNYEVGSFEDFLSWLEEDE